MRSQLSQGLLDSLATAWSRLDRARPRDPAEVPGLLTALDDWVRWAIRIDDELLGVIGPPYAARRSELPGGRPLAGIRLARSLTSRGHSIDALVFVSAGTPAVFYDVIWRRPEELPADAADSADLEEYRVHLASQPARTPASEVTTFLLNAAVANVEQT